MISLLTAFFMYYGDAAWYWWAIWLIVFAGRSLAQLITLYAKMK
jgi:hypothetical protein